MSTQIDRQTKANIDRMDERKMNRLRRVQSLPARGGLGDWVVRSETDADGEDMDVFYAWLDSEWVQLTSAGEAAEVEPAYSSTLEPGFGTEL